MYVLDLENVLAEQASYGCTCRASICQRQMYSNEYRQLKSKGEKS